ncbi:MAG: hypothetical protein Q8L29_01245 [archaeon]|nr:hypothetical protein [archaeon]
MEINELLERLKSSKNPATDKIEGIRFRGGEEGRFRYTWNNYNCYFGRIERDGPLEHKTEHKITSTSRDLGYAICYALNKGRCLELNGQPIVDSRVGFPLVMAINIKPYLVYPGVECNEDEIHGEINKRDIFVLFDSHVNYLEDLLKKHPLVIKHLLKRQNEARQEKLEFKKRIAVGI